ncbi:MAG: hypothetical protein V1754_01965, partial [Pseudomonadota bacterium]
PGPTAPRGTTFGSTSGSKLALSPLGTQVAYVQNYSGVDELFVVQTDGTGVSVQITYQTRFASGVNQIANLFWANENNLFFMAGAVGGFDVYKWDVAAATATNLTGYGSKTQPFDGLGEFSPMGEWVSPNGGWLYWIEYSLQTNERSIGGVDLSSFKVVKVVEHVDFGQGIGSFSPCSNSGMLYFSAKPDFQKELYEIWGFDQNQGQVATQLTNMGTGTYWFVRDLSLNGSCTKLVWSAGVMLDVRLIYSLSLPMTKLPEQVTIVPRNIAETIRFTPDGTTVVFGSGGSTDKETLKAVPLPGGASTTLDNQAGYMHIFTVY